MATIEETKKTTAAAPVAASASPGIAQSIQDQYTQRMDEAQKTLDQRNAQAQKTYDQRQAAAQKTYDQRQAAAQQTYDQRLAASQGKISDLYAKGLTAQQQQLKTGLDKSIAAQEEARAKIAPQYQTAANDLAVQYERNRRNLNMQAMAQGLNTGTGSQQQLALNQGFAKGYAGLRAQEVAEGAAIDRQIANLKVDYQNAVSQAMADNDYKKAAALMDDYNQQLSWLDQKQQQNQNYLDQQAAQNLNYLDNLNATNTSRYDKMYDANMDWRDSESRYRDEQALQKAQTLASFGDFSGYAAMYGQNTANTMREMWIAQNPDLAYRTGAIDAERYKAMTGNYPAGYSAGGGGGGGYWGGYSGSGSNTGGKDDSTVSPSGKKESTTGNMSKADQQKLVSVEKRIAAADQKATASKPAAKIPTFNSVWGGGAL